MRTSSKVIIIVFVAFVVALFVSFALLYTTDTEYGECVGLGQAKVDSLVYEPNVNNILVGAITIETVIIPVYIAFTSLECPVGVK